MCYCPLESFVLQAMRVQLRHPSHTRPFKTKLGQAYVRPRTRIVCSASTMAAPTAGKPTQCKAAIAWEPKKPLDVRTVTGARPQSTRTDPSSSSSAFALSLAHWQPAVLRTS